MNTGTVHQRDVLNEKRYPKYMTTFQKNRKQQYDKRNQLHSVTHNHRLGHKLPMVVKFPFISRFFEEAKPPHPYRAHRLGIFNGLYIVPEGEGLEFELPSVKTGDYDPVSDFFETPRFKLLNHGFNMMYQKIDLSPVVSLNEAKRKIKFTEDETLKDYGNYHNLTNHFTYFPSFRQITSYTSITQNTFP